MGGTGLKVTYDSICTMSKREEKLSDKELKDNICCLDHGVLIIIIVILLEIWDTEYGV